MRIIAASGIGALLVTLACTAASPAAPSTATAEPKVANYRDADRDDCRYRNEPHRRRAGTESDTVPDAHPNASSDTDPKP